METRDCYIYIRALALMRRWQLSVQSYRLHLVFLYDYGVTHRHAFSATASVDPNSGPSKVHRFSFPLVNGHSSTDYLPVDPLKPVPGLS